MGARRRSRELALQMLYQIELGGTGVDEVVASWSPEGTGEEDEETSSLAPEDERSPLEYAETLVRGVVSHGEEIDQLIRAQAEHWRLERMSVVDRSVLRMATYELLFQTDVPHVVVVDEAIELAKQFGTEQSGAFVNGILDGLLHAREFPGTLH